MRSPKKEPTVTQLQIEWETIEWRGPMIVPASGGRIKGAFEWRHVPVRLLSGVTVTFELVLPIASKE